jgi:hypothetical protein
MRVYSRVLPGTRDPSSTMAVAAGAGAAAAAGTGGAINGTGGGSGGAAGAARERKRDLYIASVVVMYALSSLGAIFVNKATLSAFNFPYSISLMLSQLVVSTIGMSVLRACRVLVIPKRSVRELTALAFPAIFLISNVTVGLLALRLVNIPMFSAFRRLSVLNVMLLEWWVLGRTASRRILCTVFVMVVGSFLAGLGDLTFDSLGYFLVFLNNFITGANLVSIKKASSVVRLGALQLNYYVTLIALPIVFILALVTGDLRAAIMEISNRPDLQTPTFAIALSLSAASAFMVNFFTNLCTQLTSPLTTAITGQMKNVLQTFLGVFAWGYKVSALNLAGLAVALSGSLCFAFYKYDDTLVARALAAAGGGGGAGVYSSIKTTDDDDYDDDRFEKDNANDSDRSIDSIRTDPGMADAAVRLHSAPGNSSVMLAVLDQERDYAPVLRQSRR